MKRAGEIMTAITQYHSKGDYKGMGDYFRSLTDAEVDNLQEFANELDIVCRKLKRGRTS
jgi:hypothetical protein